jgi:hypothetical protein
MVKASGIEPNQLSSIFISHSSTDAELALQLCNALEARRIRCWIAPRNVDPAHPYADEIVRGIESCEAFLLCASATAIGSNQVLAEVEQAHKRRKPIFTVMIGKPNVSRELDYYISRLHWIEFAGTTVDDLANRVADVLGAKKSWTEVASPPSLRRTVLYRRDAFMGSAIGTLLLLVLAGAGISFWIGHEGQILHHDFRSLGWVTLSAERAESKGQIHVHAQVWLGSGGTPFRDVTLMSSARQESGGVVRSNLTTLLNSDQIGAVEVLDFMIPAATSRLAICLTVPSATLSSKYRVTQEFSVTAKGDNLEDSVKLSPIKEAAVRKEDESSCQPEL